MRAPAAKGKMTSRERVLTAFAHQEPDRAPVNYFANPGIDRRLKEQFGDRLTFHGCVSTAGPPAYGSVREVTQTVRETLACMMPGGGYCLSPTHLIQDNTPTENVLGMYEAAHQYGVY